MTPQQKAKEYYKKATKDAKEFTEIVNENNLKTSILKLMSGFKSNKTILTDKEIDKMDRQDEIDSTSWGEINGY